MERSDKKEKNVQPSTKSKPRRLLSVKSTNSKERSQEEEGGGLPPEMHSKLQNLFRLIEKEFERLHQENVSLTDKIDLLTEKYNLLGSNTEKVNNVEKSDLNVEYTDSASNKGSKKPSTSQLMSQKLKTTYKASTSKIVSSFKIPNQGGGLYCQLVQKYNGHRDGIWEVSCCKSGQAVVGTASADRTARIWNIETGQCLISYHAHNGSVNSIRFHPTDSLVCTGSGDGSCHIWKVQIPTISDLKSKSPLESPAGSGDDEQDDDIDTADNQQISKIKVPVSEFTGHEGPIASADWWSNGTQIVTASWDRTVKLWDVEEEKVIHTLEGHELEITHASAHSVQKLIVTSSQDTTFRLWDFRLPTMHSVNVFQGHTDTVTSAVFTTKADHVVSGSDDRTVKVWDLKNMRSPLATIRLDSAVNRLSLSSTQNVIAIPHDNRQVRLYDLSGNRLSRLPRRHRQGHQRIVCATSWLDDTNTRNIQLFTAGFDKQLLGWNVVF